MSAYGCGDDDELPETPAAPSNPTPPTTTPPVVTPPTPLTFTISGTVTESFPTTFVRLEGVPVTLSSGTSRTTSSSGNFEFTEVPAGSYELRAERDGYESQVRSVTLSGSGATVTFELTPREAIIERTTTDRISQDDPICSGSRQVEGRK